MGILDSLFGSKEKEPNKDLELLITAGAFLVDVREPSEVAGCGVENALNIPLGSVLENLKAFENKDHIVVFCRSGNRSGQAKIILEQNGFTNVTNGGTWQNVNQFTKKQSFVK